MVIDWSQPGEFNAQPERPKVRAAQYVRMSTEHQKYSTDNQATAIATYAARRGYEIVRTYADEGKSGLNLGGRAGLQQLIEDIERRRADFAVVLVYDVSRWGRFQDPDKAATYELRCRRAGVAVHYCAEQFENDGSIGSSIIKTVKRAMAGEYSRELSVKVFAGEANLIRLGYRQGGSAGFGLRRLLVDQNGQAKANLTRGEHKSIATDRVILVPGPDDEVATVQAQLACNRVTRKHNQRLRHANLLGGLLFDGLGRRMKSSQAAKGAKRYHYYQTAAEAMIKAPGTAWRVPAHDKESLVIGRLREFLRDHQALRDAIGKATQEPEARVLEELFSAARCLSELLATNPAKFRSLVRRIDLNDDHLEISVSLENLLPSAVDKPAETSICFVEPETPIHILSVPVTKLRRGPEVRLVIAEPQSSESQYADPALLRLLISARAAQAAMHAAKDLSVAEVAKSKGYTNNYFTLLLRLATLAPSIVQAIIEGRQPPSLNRQRLARVTNLPLDWTEQRRVLGFQ